MRLHAGGIILLLTVQTLDGFWSPNPPEAAVCECNCQVSNAIRTQCENGDVFFSGHCYRFYDYAATWMEAVMTCKMTDSELISMETAAENQFIKDYITANYGQINFWTGATDAHKEGEWRWIANGEPVAYSDWNENEPNNSGDDGVVENCAAIDQITANVYRWNDKDCSLKVNAFICELK